MEEVRRVLRPWPERMTASAPLLIPALSLLCACAAMDVSLEMCIRDSRWGRPPCLRRLLPDKRPPQWLSLIHILAAMNLGGFFSSFWMMFLGYDLTRILLADVVLCIGLAVILLIANPFGRMENQSKK